jgi:hypothetical protein
MFEQKNAKGREDAGYGGKAALCLANSKSFREPRAFVAARKVRATRIGVIPPDGRNLTRHVWRSLRDLPALARVRSGSPCGQAISLRSVLTAFEMTPALLATV